VVKRKQLSAQQRKVAEEVAYAASRHKDLESGLEEACQAGDFERADERINDSITTLEEENNYC
jgi:hypothetical protein